jgi:hypothetical protein
VELPEQEGHLRLALKEYTYGAALDFRDYEFMRMDAIISEIFSSNPKIVDIFGFCGLGMLTQGFTDGDAEQLAIAENNHTKHRHRHKHDGHQDHDDTTDDGEQQANNNRLTPTQKLVLALEMAEAIAELHAYPGGVIVHDDIHLGQFLVVANDNARSSRNENDSPEYHLKMHDFNRAEIMLWNEADQEYCRYRNNPGNGVVRRCCLCLLPATTLCVRGCHIVVLHLCRTPSLAFSLSVRKLEFLFLILCL